MAMYEKKRHRYVKFLTLSVSKMIPGDVLHVNSVFLYSCINMMWGPTGSSNGNVLLKFISEPTLLYFNLSEKV